MPRCADAFDVFFSAAPLRCCGREQNGWTPLHFAAEKGHFDCAKLLIERGADKTARTQNGKKPHEVALQSGHPDCVRLLEIDADADANNTVRFLHFCSRMKDGPAELRCALGPSFLASYVARVAVARAAARRAAWYIGRLRWSDDLVASTVPAGGHALADTHAAQADALRPWAASSLTADAARLALYA
jgi:hypothetical protein